MKVVVIAIHDVSPGTLPEAARLRREVAERAGGPVSLLVVPRYGGRESLRAGAAREWLRDRADGGDELVLHGYSHVDRDGRDGRELSGRDPGAVGAVVRDGLSELAAAGVSADGFIAPSYAHPRSADAACREAGLRWWATRASLRSADGWRLLPSLGLGASTGGRRALSPWAADGAARAMAALPAVRLDLHPADLRHPRLAHAVGSLLDVLLDQGRRPVTHGAIARPRPAGVVDPRPGGVV